MHRTIPGTHLGVRPGWRLGRTHGLGRWERGTGWTIHRQSRRSCHARRRPSAQTPLRSGRPAFAEDTAASCRIGAARVEFRYRRDPPRRCVRECRRLVRRRPLNPAIGCGRSEEHTSELQSRSDIVCRLLLEKKKQKKSHRRVKKQKQKKKKKK